ncbi:16362_t:CDS:1, partial [Acaulospora morrowiae]
MCQGPIIMETRKRETKGNSPDFLSSRLESNFRPTPRFGVVRKE